MRSTLYMRTTLVLNALMFYAPVRSSFLSHLVRLFLIIIGYIPEKRFE